MTTCEKHGCPLTPLFTSAFCARCDEESAVNAPVSSTDADFLTRLEATLMDASDAAHANAIKGILGIGPGAQDPGWYHNYPVCGTDANGSDVDDMDVCMGLRQRAPMTVAVKIESITMWLDAGLIDEATALAWLVHV